MDHTRPSLLYGSETWVTTQRNLTWLEAAEMRFLRSVTEYTRLDKIRSEDIRQKLEISGIKDERLKHKQNWINQLERMDNTRFLKQRPHLQTTPSPTNKALTYKPRGRRDRGRLRKRWQWGSKPEQVKRPNRWRKMMMMDHNHTS